MEKNTHNENSKYVLYHQRVELNKKFDKKIIKNLII